MSDATFTELLTPADGTAARTSETALSYNLLYNGTNFDLARSVAGVTGAAAVGGPTAADGVLVAAPLTVGGRASTALPSPMSADGDVVDFWLSRNGSLNVVIRDTAGAAVSTGSQYTEDAALGAVGTGIGTLLVGRASAAAPTSVSADADAVGLWASRFGALNVIIRDTSGAAQSIGGGTQYVGDAPATATPTGTISMGLANTSAPTDVSAANDAVALWATPKGALNVVMRDTAGGFIGGLAVGDVAHDGVDSGNPIKIGGYASTASPAQVSADGDRVNAWFTRRGSLTVELRDDAGNQPSLLTWGNADAQVVANVTAISTLSELWAYNGTTADRLRTVPGVTGALAAGGLTASDAVLAAAPLTIGGRASNAAPTAMSADGDVVDARFTRTGALNVYMVDQAGAAASIGGGTQYASDVAMGTPTGTVAMGRASSPVPSSVSTDGDAVALWATGSGALVVDGGVVHDAVDSGNPEKIGGYASTATPTNVSGDADRVNAWFSRFGALNTILRDTTGNPLSTSFPGDAITNSVVGVATLGLSSGFNGTTWDRLRTVQGVATGANTDLGVVAAGVGPGYSRVPADDALATVVAGAAIDVGGASVVALQITGGATATITFEASYDGTTYFTISAQNQSTAIWSTTTTANGNFLIPVQGYYRVRANMTARTSGTFTVHKIVHFGQVFDQVSGDTAHDGVDSGNPIKVGGRARTSAITAVSNNDRVDAIYTTFGAQSMAIYDHFGNGAAVVTAGGDGISSSDAGLRVVAIGMGYNGSTLDSLRTSPGVTGTLSVGGRTASDGVLAIAPITVGGRASTATPGAVSTDGDVVDAWLSRNGALNIITRDTTGAYVAPILLPGGDALTGGQVAASGSTVYNGASWDRARSTTATDGNTALTPTGIQTVGIGPGFSRRINPANLPVTNGGTSVVDVNGASVAVIGIHTATTGTLFFEGTVDGTTWSSLWYMNIGTGQVIQGAFTPTLMNISVNTAGLRQLRIRIASTLGAVLVHSFTLSMGDAGISRDPNAALSPTEYFEDNPLASNASQGGLIVGRASTATPSAVSADGDAIGAWFTRNGAQVITISDASGNGTAATAGTVDAVGNTATALLVQSRPTFYNGSTWDRARSIESLSAAPNVDTGIPAVGVGPGWDRKRTGSAMAVTLNAATTLVVNGASAVMFALKFNSVTVGTGTLIFEVAADDVTPTWVTAPTVMKMPDLTAVSGTFSPATATQYLVGTGGWRQVRVRVASALTSGTIDVLTTSTATNPMQVLADRQRMVSYGAVFRLAEAASSLALSFTHVANTTKQYATIHHAATALKLVKIRKVTFWLYSTSAALDGVLELRRITSAPATGNPAITPAAHDPASPAAEVTCLALPTTAGTEAAVNSPVASIGLNTGIVAGGTSNNAPVPFVLWDSDKYTDLQALNIRPLTLEGWAIDLRAVGTPVVKATIEVQLTEE